ncbi:MAG: hypothetical protein ACT4OM_00205 [Actinomycetota bacterium]
MSSKPGGSRTLRLCALVALSVLGLTLALPAQAQVAFANAEFSGYASGTYVHADALTLGTPVVNLDLAVSGAATNSKGLNTQITSGLDQVVAPASPGKKSYGRGSGLDLAALSSQLINQRAEAAAPPSTELLSRPLVGPLDIPGILNVTALEGQAQARYDDNTCILGQDLSFGLGRAANARVLGGVLPSLSGLLGTKPSNVPDGGAVRTASRTRLVPQTGRDGAQIGPNLGLLAETRQTLAPVVLFQGIPGAELTIELLGEWVLRAVATGVPGGAYVQYQPATAGATPVLKISNTLPVVGEVVDSVLVTLNQLLGQTPLPGLLNGDVLGLGLVDLALNPAPTVTEAADGTSARAVVDVVRVRLLPGATGILGQLTNSLIPNLELADVRIGHMEVEAKAPAGGIVCPGLTVKKSVDKENVNAGESFNYNVRVTNPYDCELTANRLGDKITVERGMAFKIGTANPAANTVNADSLVFNDIGAIAPRASRDVNIPVSVDSNSAGGTFTNLATAISNCSLDSAQGNKINVELQGQDEIKLPKVAAAQKPVLPITGGNAAFQVGMAALLAALSAGSVLGYRRLRTNPRTGA